MNKNSKFFFQANEKNIKEGNSHIYGSSHIRKNSENNNNSVPFQFERNEYNYTGYLEINQFREYRSSMLKKINAEKINNSFLEIRQLISSVKDVLIDSNNTNINSYNSKVENSKVNPPPSLINSPISRVNENSDMYDANLSLLSKSKESPLSAKKTNPKKTQKDQVSKLLTNLHIYLNNNLSEINVMKNSVKKSSIEKGSQDMIDKINMFESKGNKTQENAHSDLSSQIEDPFLIAQKKIHKIQVEKLLSKIKETYERENKTLEKINSLKLKEDLTLQNLCQGFLIVNTKISGLVNEEVWLSENNKKKFFNSIISEDYYLIISKDSLKFLKTLSDSKEIVTIETNTIIDVTYFLNEVSVDLNSRDYEILLNENFSNYFTGFQLKLSSKNFMFMSVSNIFDMAKLDNFFFLMTAYRSNPNIDLFFKFSKCVNVKNSIFVQHELGEKNKSFLIKKENLTPLIPDPDLSNLPHYQNFKRMSLISKKESEKNLEKKMSILGKIQTNDDFKKKVKINSMKNEKKDNEYKYSKAIKILRNGFLFVKYGKNGNPHERLVYLNCNGDSIEWRDLNKKKSNGKIDISKIVEIKEEKVVKNIKRIAHSSENTFFSIYGKGIILHLETGTEKMKSLFVSSLKFIMEN